MEPEETHDNSRGTERSHTIGPDTGRHVANRRQPAWNTATDTKSHGGNPMRSCYRRKTPTQVSWRTMGRHGDDGEGMGPFLTGDTPCTSCQTGRDASGARTLTASTHVHAWARLAAHTPHQATTGDRQGTGGGSRFLPECPNPGWGGLGGEGVRPQEIALMLYPPTGHTCRT